MVKRSAKQLVAEANAAVDSLPPEQAAKLVGDPTVLFLDVREPPEIAGSGLVDGAINVPRGLLEFQADPDSPTHRAELSEGRRLVIYCGSGARSALAAKRCRKWAWKTSPTFPEGSALLRRRGRVFKASDHGSTVSRQLNLYVIKDIITYRNDQ